ncbi:unnamed protein product [Blepharisma stoltei]|uniref:Uncharacterized protein n=1 Tax=Blepharisma stoltei TaxID=1481888 RepID=A0AAU9I9Z7_9CILI|nr:unnamed protein product [Blepharisma stoltei]
MADTLDGEERVKNITLRLRRIREELIPLFHGEIFRSKEVPEHIKEEIAEIYTLYGGASILMEICNVTYDQMKAWKNKLKRNPNYFKEKMLKKSNCTNFSEAVLEKAGLEYELPLKRVFSMNETKISKKYKNMPISLSDLRKVLPEKIQEKCDEIKKMIKRTDDCKGFKRDVKAEIIKVVLQYGEVKPIALYLGIKEKTILGWREFIPNGVSKYQYEDESGRFLNKTSNINDNFL